jgi:LPS export ABC transporter protein LptC
MDNKKIYFLILIIFIISGYLAYRYYYKPPDDDNKLSPEEAMEQVVDDIIIHEPPVRIDQGQVLGVKDEKKEWMIEADSISIAQDRENTLFENIREMIIFKDEEPSLTISAQKCIANMYTKDMELSGGVVITKEDGDYLKGERVFWHSDDERLSSSEQVELQVDDNHIIAGGFSANKEMTQLELFDGARVTMKL